MIIASFGMTEWLNQSVVGKIGLELGVCVFVVKNFMPIVLWKWICSGNGCCELLILLGGRFLPFHFFKSLYDLLN